jgi:hypothetical protein
MITTHESLLMLAPFLAGICLWGAVWLAFHIADVRAAR